MARTGDTADVIIVGAGSAGCLLAAELSADPSRRVLLLEAGGRDRNPMYHIPLLVGTLMTTRIGNWNYMTEPEPGLNGRSDWWPRGKVLGGSSTINGMMWIRGRPSDYDGWAQAGLPAWGWDQALAGFRRMERFQEGGSEHHGGEGPLHVTSSGDVQLWKPLYDAFLAAGAEAGYPLTGDFNAPPYEGVGIYHSSVKAGRRCSSAKAFLNPAEGRPNLRVVTGAQAARVLIEDGRAVGVAARVAGQDRSFHAGEVVLCGGAINSPQLLMLSGVGPAAQLREHGIAVKADLAGVGANLHDHAQVVVRQGCQGVRTLHWLRRIDRGAMAVAQHALTGRGAGAYMPGGVGFFLRSDESLEEPDLQGVFVPGSGAMGVRHPFSPPPGPDAVGLMIYQLRPESRGALTLRSADPFAHPRMVANYFADPRDRAAVRGGVRVARKIFSQPAFAHISTGETAPGPQAQSDAAIDAWAAQTACTVYHPVGTCRMGVEADQGAVVDGELKVRGIAGLRVADASVMPRITSGNTNAPAMLIGQRCADFMLGRTGAEAQAG
jgi:choline dehydrogenase